MTEPTQELSKEEQWKQMEAAAMAEMEAEERRLAEAAARQGGEARAKAEADGKAKAEAEARAVATQGSDVLGSLIADAAKALSASGTRSRTRDVALVALLVANLAVMAWFAFKTGGSTGAGHPGQPVGPKADQPAEVRHDEWQEALRAGREKRHLDAIGLLERHLQREPLPAEELLLVYQQLSLQCRLGGRLADSARYGAFAQSLSHRSWRPEDLLESADAARGDGRAQDARRILARFLLMEGGLSPHGRTRMPKAILDLAETYQDEAARAESKKP